MLKIAQGGFLVMGRLSRLGKLTDFLLDSAALRLPSVHRRLVILDQWFGPFGLLGFIVPDRSHEEAIAGRFAFTGIGDR